MPSAKLFDVNPVTVTNVRKAFSEGGLEQALNRNSRKGNMNIVWMGTPKPI